MDRSTLVIWRFSDATIAAGEDDVRKPLDDGRLLRTGTANFSASGLKRQENDLIVIESSAAAAAFKRAFDAQLASGEPLSIGATL